MVDVASIAGSLKKCVCLSPKTRALPLGSRSSHFVMRIRVEGLKLHQVCDFPEGLTDVQRI